MANYVVQNIRSSHCVVFGGTCLKYDWRACFCRCHGNGTDVVTVPAFKCPKGIMPGSCFFKQFIHSAQRHDILQMVRSDSIFFNIKHSSIRCGKTVFCLLFYFFAAVFPAGTRRNSTPYLPRETVPETFLPLIRLFPEAHTFREAVPSPVLR